jgi:hypothetical protein
MNDVVTSLHSFIIRSWRYHVRYDCVLEAVFVLGERSDPTISLVLRTNRPLDGIPSLHKDQSTLRRDEPNAQTHAVRVNSRRYRPIKRRYGPSYTGDEHNAFRHVCRMRSRSEEVVVGRSILECKSMSCREWAPFILVHRIDVPLFGRFIAARMSQI